MSQTPPDGDPPRAWLENYDLLVEVAGQSRTDSRIYTAKGRPAVLVMIPDAARAIVVDTLKRVVLTAERSDVREGDAAGNVALADASIGGEPLPLTIERDVVIFFLDGRKHRITRRPPLLGEVTLEALLAQIPVYRKGMDAYAPTPGDIHYLKGLTDKVRIQVFFGSWCPHCRITVPRFMKTMQEAANENLQVIFVGVPSPFGDYPPAKEKQIDGVPTFIVYSGDKEIGRFGDFESDSSVEHELVKLLYQWKQSGG